MSQTSLNFYLHQPVFTCWNGLTGFFSSLWFYFFLQAWLNRLFSSWRFYFSAKPTLSSNHGGKWHRPRILWARKQVIGSGNWTLDPQKDHAARPGNRTLDLQKRSHARSGVRTLDRLKKIVRTIVYAIANYDRAHESKISRAYEIRAGARASSKWNVSARRRTTARPTEKRTMDRPF